MKFFDDVNVQLKIYIYNNHKNRHNIRKNHHNNHKNHHNIHKIIQWMQMLNNF